LVGVYSMCIMKRRNGNVLNFNYSNKSF